MTKHHHPHHGMEPQVPHHKEEYPNGLPDTTVEAAHDFLEQVEHASEDEMASTTQKSRGLGKGDKSMMDKAKDTMDQAKAGMGMK